jgi:hypothetical protein
MREARGSSASLQELAVQRRKEPGLHFGQVTQLVAFAGSFQKGLLREVVGFRFVV